METSSERMGQPMPEPGTMTRSWRTDPVKAEAPPDSTPAMPRRTGRCGPSRLVAAIASAWSRAFGGRPTPYEDALDGFAADLSAATDPRAVEAALIRLARRVSPAGRVELIQATGGRPDAQGRITPSRLADPDGPAGGGFQDFRLRCGPADHGILRVHLPEPTAHREGRPELRRRLTTACTLAACALEGARLHEDWARASAAADEAEADPAARALHPRRDVVRDATFLNAVLPFALEQSRRHGEPLSLICLKLDRLGAIRDLLGEPMADRLVHEMGELVVSLVRSSDLVARLDDDRVVVLLVRARGENALKVARTIGHAVADSGLGAAALPGLSAAIGVAEFPTSARDAADLLEAADEAMAAARAGGSRSPVLAEATCAPMVSREPENTSRYGPISACQATS